MGLNRKDLRAIGFQGRAGMMKDKKGEIAIDKGGKSTGRRRGSFVQEMGRTPILVSNSKNWQKRWVQRMFGPPRGGKAERQIQRERARGGLS